MFCIKWKLIVALYFLNLGIEAIPSGSQKKKMASEIKSIKVKSQNSDMQPRRNKFNSRQSYYIKSRAGRHYYETENVIWARFGPVCNIAKL